jgi:hypothetical protein
LPVKYLKCLKYIFLNISYGFNVFFSLIHLLNQLKLNKIAEFCFCSMQWIMKGFLSPPRTAHFI